MKLIISFFIIDIYYIISLNSNEAWDLIIKDFSEGKLMNQTKDYFIFQENNYTKLDIYDYKMFDIYQKQKEILSLCGIRTYIFGINNISEMNITIFGSNIRDHMKLWGINIDNSIFTVSIIEQNDAFIYTGSKIKQDYISDNTVKSIKKNLLVNMNKKEFYTAWKTLIKDIEDTCYLKIRGDSGRNSNSNKIGSIIGIIVIFLLVVGGIIVCWKYGCCKRLNKIIGFNREDWVTIIKLIILVIWIIIISHIVKNIVIMMLVSEV